MIQKKDCLKNCKIKKKTQKTPAVKHHIIGHQQTKMLNLSLFRAGKILYKLEK